MAIVTYDKKDGLCTIDPYDAEMAVGFSGAFICPAGAARTQGKKEKSNRKPAESHAFTKRAIVESAGFKFHPI